MDVYQYRYLKQMSEDVTRAEKTHYTTNKDTTTMEKIICHCNLI